MVTARQTTNARGWDGCGVAREPHAMRRASALVCAMLVLASAASASADTRATRAGDAHRDAHANPQADEPVVEVAGLGEGDLTPVPFRTAYIGDFDGKRIQTTVPGGSVEYAGGLTLMLPEGARGWSSVVGSPYDGSALWVLTDNYARLLRVSLALDPDSKKLAGINSIEDAAWGIRAPGIDEGAGVKPPSWGSVEPGTWAGSSRQSPRVGGGPGKLWHEGGRVDAESLVIVPNFGTGQGAQWWNPTDPGEMVVGVEDSFNLAANNLVRFRWGRGGQYADVPGSAAVLRGSCAPNHGPKALVYLPPLYGSGLPGRLGASVLAFCSSPSPPVCAGCKSRVDALQGFLFDLESQAPARDGPIAAVKMTQITDGCELTDATATPDGRFAIFMHRCESDSSVQIRAAPRWAFRVDGNRVPSRLLFTLDGRNGLAGAKTPGHMNRGTFAKAAGIHAFSETDENGSPTLALAIVSDDDLNADGSSPTTVAKFRVRGDVYADPGQAPWPKDPKDGTSGEHPKYAIYDPPKEAGLGAGERSAGVGAAAETSDVNKEGEKKPGLARLGDGPVVVREAFPRLMLDEVDSFLLAEADYMEARREEEEEAYGDDPFTRTGVGPVIRIVTPTEADYDASMGVAEGDLDPYAFERTHEPRGSRRMTERLSSGSVKRVFREMFGVDDDGGIGWLAGTFVGVCVFGGVVIVAVVADKVGGYESVPEAADVFGGGGDREMDVLSSSGYGGLRNDRKYGDDAV